VDVRSPGPIRPGLLRSARDSIHTCRDSAGIGFVLGNSSANNDTNPFTLQNTGTYTLTFFGTGAATGSYSFERLSAATNTLTLTPSTVTTSGSLSPGTQTAIDSFSGTAGKLVLFKNDSVSISCRTFTWFCPTSNRRFPACPRRVR
jgi:hypothetical protein